MSFSKRRGTQRREISTQLLTPMYKKKMQRNKTINWCLTQNVNSGPKLVLCLSAMVRSVTLPHIPKGHKIKTEVRLLGTVESSRRRRNCYNRKEMRFEWPVCLAILDGIVMNMSVSEATVQWSM